MSLAIVRRMDNETAIEPVTRRMTGKERAFVDAYCGEAEFVASRAAAIAGYSDSTDHSLEVEGSRLLRRAEVIRAIDQALASREITRDYVLAGLKANVEGAYGDKAYGAAISGLRELGRALGLFVDRQELDISARTVQLAAELGLDEAELAAEVKRLSS